MFTFDSATEYKLHFQDDSATIALCFFLLLCEFRSFPQITTASAGIYMCCFGARDVELGAQMWIYCACFFRHSHILFSVGVGQGFWKKKEKKKKMRVCKWSWQALFIVLLVEAKPSQRGRQCAVTVARPICFAPQKTLRRLKLDLTLPFGHCELLLLSIFV